ncbi:MULTISPECIES: TetR/AcrR family transcriptional regulator [Clostridia]|uniref:TetR/AcrR family transcriptional regulator n=1 Tax=Clostridia TaxID=186801 RepID=UPI000EA1621D|nr:MULTISPECIES: TetR/AcrR family transcriptional regulator [Clostridia]NBJ68778.1 TetR/AcrR family transcriptional regulator [Roseburia sp. 1XD42-34]RKI80160.1 TetR/AcrR family transcriptional regulator [Clostridium sp. 1xD42-85]
MLEKKRKLVEIGIKLIAQKGYHNTSIQEIANKAGVSKGSFYSYFPSKKVFMKTTMKEFHRFMMEELAQVKTNDDASARFAKQITILIKYMERHKEFITIYLRSNMLIEEEFEEQIRAFRLDYIHWLRENLESIYGKQLQEFVMDAIIQSSGLIHSYFHWLIVEDVEFDLEQAGQFMVRRLHDLIAGMVKAEASPLVDTMQIPEIYSRNNTNKQNKQEVINSLKEKIPALKVPQMRKERLYEVLQLLQNEIAENNNILVIQGLLAHFTAHDMLIEDVNRIAEVLDIELL